jgi:autotransporter-associated beta strand protein
MGFAVHAAACVALLFAGPLPSAQAQTTRTWNNSVTTGLWSTGGNWLGGTAPVDGNIAAFTSTDSGLVLTATGAVTPSLAQLYFDNAGTTTLQLTRTTLTSGTGIVVTANSGNVFIRNTSVLANASSAVVIGANQVWENNSTSGTLSVNADPALVRWTQLANNLTVRGSGRTEIGIVIGGGNVTKEGTGTLLIRGSDTGSNIGNTTVSAGTLILGDGTNLFAYRSPSITNNAAVIFNTTTGSVTFGGIISGTGTLTKQGVGNLQLLGSNSGFTGTTIVSSGTLNFAGVNANNVGLVGGNIVNNAIIQFGFNNSASTGTFAGVISGTGILDVWGGGKLVLTGSNTFSGITIPTQAHVELGNTMALQNSAINTSPAAPWSIMATTSQASLTIGGLVGTSGNRSFNSIIGTNLTDVTSLTLNPQAGSSFTFAQVIANTVSGSVRTLTKTGAGEQILQGVNTYTGLTTVSAGRLTIAGAGSINNSSGVTVNGAGAEFRFNSSTAFNKPLTLTQGILSGTGTIQTAVTVASNAIISPGNSPGSQTYASSVWQAGGTYLWELNALTGAAGTNWDRVVVTGPLDLTGLSSSNRFNINLTTLTGSDTNGPLNTPWTATGTSIFPFVSYGSLSVPSGFTTGSNSDLTALFNFDLTNWVGTPKPSSSNISVRVNPTGNGLNLVIVPEPGTIALAGIGIGTAVWFFRRRRGTA